MVLGGLGCMNNADFEEKKVNDNIVQDMFIQKLRHIQVIKKIPHLYVLLDLQSYPQSVHSPL